MPLAPRRAIARVSLAGGSAGYNSCESSATRISDASSDMDVLFYAEGNGIAEGVGANRAIRVETRA